MRVGAPLHTLRSSLILGALAIAACTKPAPLPVNQDVEIPHSSASSAPTASGAAIDSGNASASSAPQRLDGRRLTVSVNGFMQSCARSPSISVSEDDGGAHVATTSLPGKGNYFLDGAYVGYGMCDVVDCIRVEDTTVDLIEYEKIGVRTPPGGQGHAPVFRTLDLKGTITVTLATFSDDKCTVSKTLTQTVVR